MQAAYWEAMHMEDREQRSPRRWGEPQTVQVWPLKEKGKEGWLARNTLRLQCSSKIFG